MYMCISIHMCMGMYIFKHRLKSHIETIVEYILAHIMYQRSSTSNQDSHET